MTKSSENVSKWLKTTRYIDHDNPKIKSLANDLVKGKETDREKAVAIHTWVRDNIKFGFGPYFYRYKASEVLKLGRGFCNTQSTLFCALLRSQGIPARPHFVEISADVLKGFQVPGPFVDHSYSEAYINGKWVRTDSYICDPELVKASKAKLKSEGLKQGYGLALEGTTEWDGESDSFIQYVGEDVIPGSTRQDFGPFEDVQAFYKAKGIKRNNGGIFTLTIFYFVGDSINAAVEALR